LDLSSSFREQRLEREAEAKSQCDDRGGCDGTDDVAPDLNPITEEAAASLDTVTERLMVLMREKGQREQHRSESVSAQAAHQPHFEARPLGRAGAPMIRITAGSERARGAEALRVEWLAPNCGQNPY